MINFLFYLFAAIAILCAMMTVSRRNPVASALWLIGAFFSLAAIYTLLGAYFIGIIQILVYAGAIMVLFLFVIMLLNLGNEYEPDFRGTVWKVVAGGTSLVMIALLARMSTMDASIVGAGGGPDLLSQQVAEQGVVGVIGIPMFTEFMVPLQVTGILLLVAVVGAVALAKRRI
jgi:NADH-quinone oxidoreductase subunit J